MTLRLTPPQLAQIRQHGARDYPSECCGMLLGKADGDAKQASEVVATARGLCRGLFPGRDDSNPRH
ncbi:MAG: Mov34/MPN/PAD-1 family protein [Acidobacteriia bacterium]|nr:Mov34/MPN/PAD-1 family protein [Terriglobia bacterium]